MEVQPELILDLRKKFFKKLDDEGPPDPTGFHPADIARVEDSDAWLKRFLEHNDNNLQESLNMLWESCTWRKKFEANEITEESVKREFLVDGLCFIYGKDKDGIPMFVIRSKYHTKGSKDFNELRKLVVYWFERLERQTNGNQISLFFDMTDTGILNMDMEFIKYLIGLCKNYYPNFLNYIIIFEMPWILNTAFRIIKTWLPAKAIPKIKFVHKSNISEFVDANDALVSWGGSNEYTYTFVPEAQNNDTSLNGKLNNKKVHFAEGSPLTEQSPTSFGDQSTEDQMLSVDQEVITFNKMENEVSGTITLRNITTDKPLSYKVKTTSPEKFKVRPRQGILLPQEQRVVSVVLHPGYNVRGLLHNDKFLVMCLPLKDANTSAEELAAVWESKKPAEQHRLLCCDGGAENHESQKSHSMLSSGMSESGWTMDTLYHKITHLRESNAKLHSDITFLKYILLLSILVTVLIAVMVVYILRIDIKNAMDEQACHIHRGI